MLSDHANNVPAGGGDFEFLFLRDEDELEDALTLKRDEFLDIYSLYQKTGLSYVKEELFRKAYELSLLDPEFTFYI